MMLFKYFRTSDRYLKKGDEEVEINTLQELIEWIKEAGYDVIISILDDENILEIYDNWRE